MGVEGYARSRVFSWDQSEFLGMEVPFLTSAGRRPGPRVKMQVNDHTELVLSANGKKFEQLDWAMHEVVKFVNRINSEEIPPLPACAWEIVLKHEVHIPEGETREELARDKDKLASKAREFFIGCLFYFLISMYMQRWRQKIERGRMIKIGFRWWYGGAEDLAKQMQYNSGKYVYFDADFKGFDTTVKMFLLFLYSTQLAYYHDFRKMEPEDVRIFKVLLKICTTVLSIKVVHTFGSMWRMMFGVMPSGAFETSHGNSWIVGFTFFHYLATVMIQNPSRRKVIRSYLMQFLILVIVYGDDHIIGVPDELYDIINQEGYRRFLEKYYDMILRNCREFRQFLSTVDEYGELQEKGAVFLRRYLVPREQLTSRRDVAKVLPFRPTSATIKKFAHGSGLPRTRLDYVLCAIGMAYDNSTNKHAYEFCRFMYDYFLDGQDFNTLVEQADFVQDNNLTRIMMKAGISEKEIREGFPTAEKLMDMHVPDDIYVRFQVHDPYIGDV